jgi:dipeptidyl aminopeptidase/acylaminoacyl peptidase
MRLLFITLTFFAPFFLNAQKQIIDHTVYSKWKTLSSTQVSRSGKFVSYEINPQKGDGFLYVYNTETQKLDSFPRSSKASFAGDESYLTFFITPGYDTLRTCELNKVDKKKWPKDSLGVLNLGTNSLVKFDRIKAVRLSKESNIGLFYFDHNDKVEVKKKKCKKKKEVEVKSDGLVLGVYEPGKDLIKFNNVKEYTVSDNGNFFAFTYNQKVKCDSVKLYVLDRMKNSERIYSSASTDIQKVVFSKNERFLTYLNSADTAKQKNYMLRLVDLNTSNDRLIADTASLFLNGEQSPSVNFEPIFTVDEKRLFYGVSKKAFNPAKDSLLESEKAKLDVWHYGDLRLQPQQLKELKRDEKRTHGYVYDLEKGTSLLLSDDTLELSVNSFTTSNYVLGSSDNPYQSRYNWEYPWKSDYYRVNLQTGERQLIRRGEAFSTSLSPSGRFFAYFTGNGYSVVDLIENREYQSPSDPSAIWTEDMNGMTSEASPYGIIGWEKGEEALYLQERNQLYRYAPIHSELECITCIVNEADLLEIRPELWDKDSVYIDLSNSTFVGFDLKTKGTHLFTYKNHGDHFDVVEQAYYDAKAYEFKKSERGNTFLFRKMTVTDYPDLYTHNGDFVTPKRISMTNPQQDQYIWPTVELIDWKTSKGIELEGLVYKPEDFDPSKSYPLIVYFYELYSDRFHQHYVPKSTASIVFPTEYTSAGYVVFIPDIRYESGYPARSAYDCIMTGTDAVLRKYSNIDSTRMGLQGQSWGGYQTAQLITMTNRYAAAMAGAPVSNMFSAYGGIRWGSGINRQFQYEKAQSRIGFTIWEKPELYIENSPLFHVPNIQTPLLMMHNDMDGAVPWYQGIEMFTAMKRLDKPVWMLNYNEDDHNLTKEANKLDLSIRMRQFFDYYLQGKAAPKWLELGVPAIEKGVDYGLEILKK